MRQAYVVSIVIIFFRKGDNLPISQPTRDLLEQSLRSEEAFFPCKIRVLNRERVRDIHHGGGRAKLKIRTETSNYLFRACHRCAPPVHGPSS